MSSPPGAEPRLRQFPTVEELAVPADFPGREMLQSFRAGPAVLFFRWLLKACGVTPRGVIHLGAHEGPEILPYLMLGYDKILFVEPNPKVFQVLRRNLEYGSRLARQMDDLTGQPPRRRLWAFQAAVGEANGTATLSIYPDAPELSSTREPTAELAKLIDTGAARKVRVPVITLDALMAQASGCSAADFNVLYANIEGSELLALRGATRTLAGIELVYLEVNLTPHHQEDPTAEQLDEFLAGAGFARRHSFIGFVPGNGYLVYRREAGVDQAR